VQCDISQPVEIDRMFEEIVREFGNVQILVNNAARFVTGTLSTINAQNYVISDNLNCRGKSY
jgi:NAD(P)-dependent dehydrogenase (short-subunit alcohol dehydrogenase family)